MRFSNKYDLLDDNITENGKYNKNYTSLSNCRVARRFITQKNIYIMNAYLIRNFIFFGSLSRRFFAIFFNFFCCSFRSSFFWNIFSLSFFFGGLFNFFFLLFFIDRSVSRSFCCGSGYIFLLSCYKKIS